MLTIHDVCRAAGDDTYTNEHMFAWLSQALASDAVNVACEFPLGPDDQGNYTVTIRARAI